MVRRRSAKKPWPFSSLSEALSVPWFVRFSISLEGQRQLLGAISVWIHDSALREEDECAEEVSRRSNQTSSLFTAPLTALSTRNQSNNLENERSAKNPTRTRAFDLT